MRRLVLCALALAMLGTGCIRNAESQVQATSASPGVNPSASPTVESISPTSAASAYPSGSPSPSSSAATGAGGGSGRCREARSDEVEVLARGIAFDTECIQATAGAATSVELRNEDSMAHTFSVYDGDREVFRGEPTEGGEDRTYRVPALDAGTYRFQCDIHPSMNGRFVVSNA
jgi:plastocyanin